MSGIRSAGAVQYIYVPNAFGAGLLSGVNGSVASRESSPFQLCLPNVQHMFLSFGICQALLPLHCWDMDGHAGGAGYAECNFERLRKG